MIALRADRSNHMVHSAKHALMTASRRGLTLLELIVACAIIGILAAIAIPLYSNYVYKSQVNTSIADIRGLEVKINAFYSDNVRYPNELGELNMAILFDPWGTAYQYINIYNAGDKVKCRKDKSEHPLNSDYDLYSMGKDRDSKLPLTAQASQDDIIRARDGRYIGLAADF